MLIKLIQNKLSASCASILIIVTFMIILDTSNGLSLASDRDGRKLFGGYKITPKFCTDAKISKADAKVSGPAICMFNHECVERKGKVIGACMDGFLFGTCCLLSGVVETSLANVKENMTSYQQAAAMMEELATRGPLAASSKPQIINNQFYGTNDDDSSIQVDENIKQELLNDAVMVSSPSYADRISSPLYYPTKSTSQQSFVTELPTFIQSSSTYFTSDDELNDHNDLVSFSKVPYDHSGISHTSAEADVYSTEDGDDNNIINPYPIPTSSNHLITETRTTETSTQPPKTTSKFSKPIFKPKPTQSSSTTEKYVLVHTITNDKPQLNDNANENVSTKKPSTTNDSIQSIILMLNGTNSSGPEYDVDSSNVNNENTQATSTYGSTSMIDYDKYGSSSFYVTTKMPERITSVKVPSTSYIYSPNPTRRPTTSTTRKSTEKSKTTTTRSVSKKTSTKKPPTTINVPSTSYIYSPNPITKRPAASSTAQPISDDPIASTTANKKKTSPKPILVVSTQQHEQIQQHHQQEDIQTNYVVISGGGITKHPSPTVHITPKPITNLLTSSTATQLKQTKPPNELTGEQSSSERPQSPFYGSTTPTTFVSSSIYVPGIEDFHNEGYYAVVTQRPGVLSTAIYAVSPGLINTSGGEPENDTPIMNNDDFSNFPPVRNPNLNMTATNNVQESDISTPSFIEDSQLNNKIDLLVNKLIESMQGNLDNLVDIVYDKKNVSSVNLDNKKKNTTLADAPPTKVPKTTVKQTAPTKPPAKTTTAPPGRPSSQQQTSKKPPAKTSTAATTKKPITTKKPATQKPNAQTTSKKPPNRVTSASTTKKPTKKATTTTTTTEAPLAQDEYLEGEEAPVEEEGGQEETVEEGDETNVVDETDVEQPAATPSGKIQCGVRPQYKKGRIVGGTAAAFGEFPWQVLVRESTWLGLFTKNKCGGVLISNSYVLTAAHCQPGFLASLVAVFGEHDISGELETKRSVTKNVKRVIVHRQYDAATFENDLAILELESPVRYDSHIVPVCMPPDGTDYTGKVATVSGWGRLKYGGGVPSVLQEVQVPIIENTVCQDMFEHAGHKKKILSSFLCAGYANGQKDSCEG
ncbi:hypothetical protein ACKWTF_008762 [Chironomus riparius]